MTTNNEQLLEIKDVLPILKVNNNTFRSWMRRNQLPQGLVLEIGNTKRIRKIILDKWLAGDV